LTDFHNSFTDTFSRELAIKLLTEIQPHLKCVAVVVLFLTHGAVFITYLLTYSAVSVKSNRPIAMGHYIVEVDF